LFVNGSIDIAEKSSSARHMGLLRNAGTVIVNENGFIDCKGSIETSGTFTNNGTIWRYPYMDGYPQYGTITGVISGSQPVAR